jgi:hypothetical protein
MATYMSYSNKTHSDFTVRFGIRYETIKKKLEKKGVEFTNSDEFRIIQTNSLSINDAAIRLCALANQLPDIE